MPLLFKSGAKVILIFFYANQSKVLSKKMNLACLRCRRSGVQQYALFSLEFPSNEFKPYLFATFISPFLDVYPCVLKVVDLPAGDENLQ
jgi:hypothetical protein